MDELKMAHEFAMKQLENSKGNITIASLKSFAWEYADAMQAEADKREHKHLFLNGQPCSCGVSTQDVVWKIGERQEIREEEWQPDWSQAPDGFDWLAIDGVGPFWYRNMPTWDGEEWSAYKDDREGSSTENTMPFGYKGKYINSLRKRPEGK